MDPHKLIHYLRHIYVDASRFSLNFVKVFVIDFSSFLLCRIYLSILSTSVLLRIAKHNK